MTKLVQIVSNAVNAKLVTREPVLDGIISNLLSYTVEGVAFMNAGSWDGRSSFFSHQTGIFPAGFVFLVSNELSRRGYRVQHISKVDPVDMRGPESPIVDEFGNDDPRYDFQLKALRQVEKHHRGIIQVATGGGKSKIAKLITARYRQMTLFLTTRGVLMYQMKEAYEECGFTVGVIGDGQFTPKKGVNVGMVQTLNAQLEETTEHAELLSIIAANEKKGITMPRPEMIKLARERVRQKQAIRQRTVKLLSMVKVVIGEEAHEVGGAGYFNILKHCRNAGIRVALTATPFMRASTEDNMKLMASFGPVLIKVSEKLLIDRGILARPYFKFMRVDPHPKLRKTSPWQRARQLGIVEGEARNKAIIHHAAKAARRGMPVMILVQMTRHGEALQKALRAKGLRFDYIRGENDQIERKRALTRLKNGKIHGVIGTTILDVGVDVPAVSMVILAGGGKAEVALRQRIGRGLRAKKVGPNVCFVLDFRDDLNTYLRDHARQRRLIIEDTPGFNETILGDNEDFDWGMFEEREAA